MPGRGAALAAALDGLAAGFLAEAAFAAGFFLGAIFLAGAALDFFFIFMGRTLQQGMAAVK